MGNCCILITDTNNNTTFETMKARTRKTKSFKTEQAEMASIMRRELKKRGIKCGVRSFNSCGSGVVSVYKKDVDDSFSAEDGETICWLGEFYGLSGVYGTELTSHGKEKPRYELYV